MKTIVISGINIFEGGALSVFKDFLDNIIKCKIHKSNNITVFVHKKELFAEYVNKMEIIEIQKSRKNYLYRLWYEYIYFYFYSRQRNIDIWISLHDITPNVKAKKRYVYCHNPSPFMKTELKMLKYSYKSFLFSLLYKYLYRININKNDAVIVQQEWIRREFIKMYKLKNVIVAKPTVNIEEMDYKDYQGKSKTKYQFIYPAFPRFFKNFEVICEACKRLEKKGVNGFEVYLTIDGSENKYAREIYKKYNDLQTVKFIGLQDRMSLFTLYREADCMIFPSKLETWGLPISEFKHTSKPILLADLPYAHETVGLYNKVSFFHPNDAKTLSELMEREILGTNIYTPTTEICLAEPYANNWKELFDIILF